MKCVKLITKFIAGVDENAGEKGKKMRMQFANKSSNKRTFVNKFYQIPIYILFDLNQMEC